MPLPEVASDHYRQRQAFVTGGAQVAGQAWADVDPANIVPSWTARVPELTVVVSGAQLGAARAADPYLEDALAWQDVDATTDLPVDPSAFAGVASDGRGLVDLLMSPAFQALQMIGSGLGAGPALDAAGQHLDTIVRTQVADAGRVADGVSLTAHRQVDGYVRIVVGRTCSRCLILAGKRYRWNAGFQRHPRCDCVHLPAAIAEAGRLLPNPRRIYQDMSTLERRRAGWSLADQRAIADGADLNRVTNAARSTYTAGGRRFTREGAGRRARLTPEQIYAEAGEDRDEAIRLLTLHGYVTERSVGTFAGPERIRVGAAALGPGEAAGAAAVRPPLAVREALRKPTTAEVEQAFVEEARHIAGRQVEADFAGSALETAQEHAEGLLRGLEVFPDTSLQRIGPGARLHRRFAEADSSGDEIRYNLDEWAAPERRQAYLDELRLSAGLPNGTRYAIPTDPVAAIIHEYGHIVDYTLGEGIHDEVLAAAVRRAEERGIGADVVVREEIGEYASGDIGEAIAEAFADVVINGEAASALSREIFDLLDRDYRAGGRALGRIGTGAARALGPAGMTEAEFDARVGAARAGRRAVDAARVRVEVDASAGSDVGRWRAVEAAGVSGSPRGLLSAITRRVRTSGPFNERLRFPEGRPMAQWEINLRASYPDEMRLQLEARDAAQRAAEARTADRDIAALDRAMAQSPLPSDVVVWRGSRAADIGLPGGAVEGFEWTDPGYLGTSGARSVAEHSFAGGREGALLRILAPEGTPAISIAGGGESELLLGRGLHYRVVADRGRTASGARLLDVEVRPTGPVERVARTASAPDLATMRVGELRALAGEQGIPLPAGAKRADIEHALRHPEAAHQAAELAKTAAVRKTSDLLEEVQEVIANGVDPAVLRRTIEATAKRSGTPPRVRDALLRAVDDGADAVLAAVDRAAAAAKLTPVEANAGAPARFTPTQHKPLPGTRIRPGAPVVVVRPGYYWSPAGEKLLLSKATVEEITEAEFRDLVAQRAARAELKAAQARQAVIDRARGVADLVAETGQLLADGAERDVLRARIAASAKRLKVPDAIRDSLLKAVDRGDMAALRRALTAARTKFKLKAVGGTPGRATKFDPKVHKPLGERPKPGQKVEVVRPGHTVTLPSGEVVQLDKAVVEIVDVAPKVPPRPKLTESTFDARQAELRQALREAVLDARPLGGGTQAATTLEITTDGRRFVRKVFPSSTGRQSVHLIDAEELGSRVLEALGVRSPAVVRVSQHEIVIEYIDGTVGSDIVGWGQAAPREVVDSRDARLIGLADFLTYHVDRNAGNWIRLADGRIAAIDQASMFLPAREVTGELFGLYGDFGQYLVGAQTELGPVLRDALDMSWVDLAAVRSRLQALRPEFAARRRLGWFNAMMRLLREVEKRAI